MNGGVAYSSMILCWVLLTRVGSTVFFDDFQTQWWISMQIYYLEGSPVPINVLDLRRRRRDSAHPGNATTPQEEEEEERAFVGGQRGSLFYDPCVIDFYMYFAVPFVVPLFTGGKSKKVVKREVGREGCVVNHTIVGRNESGQEETLENEEIALVHRTQVLEFDEIANQHSQDLMKRMDGALTDARKFLNYTRKPSTRRDQMKFVNVALNSKFHNRINNQSVQYVMKKMNVSLADVRSLDFHNIAIRVSNQSASKQMKSYPLVHARVRNTSPHDVLQNVDVALIDERKVFRFNNTTVRVSSQSYQEGLRNEDVVLLDEMKLFDSVGVMNQSSQGVILFEFNNTVTGIKNQSGQDVMQKTKLMALEDGRGTLKSSDTIIRIQNKSKNSEFTLVNPMRLFEFNDTNLTKYSGHVEETTKTSTPPSQSFIQPAFNLQCRHDSYNNASSAGVHTRRKRTIFHEDHVVSYYLCTIFYINDVFYDVFYSYLDFFIPLGLSTGRSRGRAMDLIYDDVQLAVYITIDVPFLVPILRSPVKDKYVEDYDEEDY